MTQNELEQLRAAHLVETNWLNEHLSDPNLRIVDVRGAVKLALVNSSTKLLGTSEYLSQHSDYLEGHIPGAIYLDWQRDIVDLDQPVPVQVASAAKLAQVLGELGIGDEYQVIAYDNHPTNQFAVRLWWTFRYAGQHNIRVLNGGLTKWLAENRPIEQVVPHYPVANFTVDTQADWLITAEKLLAKLNQTDLKIVDARDKGRYDGTMLLNGRAGHIPGAVSLPHIELFNPLTHTFKSAEEIAALLKTRFAEAKDQEIVAYCGGGVAATVVLFSLSMAGYTNLTHYGGSWNEWGERADLPVEVAVQES